MNIKASPDFIVEPDACKAADEAGGICALRNDHPGNHRYLDCTGAGWRLVDGSVVPFLGGAR